MTYYHVLGGLAVGRIKIFLFHYDHKGSNETSFSISFDWAIFGENGTSPINQIKGREGGLAKKQRTWTTNDLAYDVTPHKCRRKKEK